MIKIPTCIETTNKGIGYYIGSWFLKFSGWTIAGEFPNTPKFIAVVAPHTSNWDFFIALALRLHLGIKAKFLGKHSIFVGPIGTLLRACGGIPVDRRSPQGIVKQAAEAFSKNKNFILGIAPEGTRKQTAQWKSGFMRIALAAKVPVVPMALDYRNKTFVVMPAQTIEADTKQELERIKAMYEKNMAKYPEKVSGL